MRCHKKKTRLQYCDSGQIVESAWSHTYWLHADSTIWPESQYCSRINFFWHRIILRTNSKFQTPLTLNSHKSGLKNHRIKNYHIFGTSRTSVFIWHPRIPHENFCIGVICKNAKKYRFFPFSVSRRWKKVRGRRSDNFEATGRAQSSFWSLLPILLGGAILPIGENIISSSSKHFWNVCRCVQEGPGGGRGVNVRRWPPPPLTSSPARPRHGPGYDSQCVVNSLASALLLPQRKREKKTEYTIRSRSI